MVAGLTAAGSLSFYAYTTYMPKFLVNTAHFSKGDATLVSAGSLFVYMCFQPVMGSLSDRLGRKTTLIMAFGAGTLLTFSRVRLALTVEGRDPRRHVPAVDARGDEDTGEEPAVSPGASSLFGRVRRPPEPPPEPPSGAAAPDAIAAARAEDDEALRRSRERRRRRLEDGADEAPEERPG